MFEQVFLAGKLSRSPVRSGLAPRMGHRLGAGAGSWSFAAAGSKRWGDGSKDAQRTGGNGRDCCDIPTVLRSMP